MKCKSAYYRFDIIDDFFYEFQYLIKNIQVLFSRIAVE